MEKYFMHPVETDCAVKLEIVENCKETYFIKFKGGKEYKPRYESNIVGQARLQQDEIISKEEYNNF